MGSSFSLPSSTLKEEIGIPQQVGSRAHVIDVSVKSILVVLFVRLLSNQSYPDERMFCIALVRKDPTCPNRSESLFFHESVLIIWKEAMHLSHCRSKLDRNQPSLQGRVLPLLVPIQPAANSQFESTLASTQVSLPQYSSQQHDSYNSIWRGRCVSLHNW